MSTGAVERDLKWFIWDRLNEIAHKSSMIGSDVNDRSTWVTKNTTPPHLIQFTTEIVEGVHLYKLQLENLITLENTYICASFTVDGPDYSITVAKRVHPFALANEIEPYRKVTSSRSQACIWINRMLYIATSSN